MRTLLLAPELFAAEGGIARILRLYLKALCELSSPEGSVQLLVLNDETLPAARLARYVTPRLSSATACARSKAAFVGAALRSARRTDFLVCGHVGQLPVAWLCRLLSPRLRYVLVAHGIEVWRPFTWWERLALRGASQIWCVSDFTRRELLRHVVLAPGRALVLPNGLDPELTEVPAKPASMPTLLAVSRLCRSDAYKCIDQLIRALPLIRRAVPDATLRIVGDGDDRARLETLASQAGVETAVTFLGHVDDSALKEEFAACRVFALPSAGEGFGLVFLEAMAQGKPCVGADAGGVPEVISPESGLLCPAGDVAALSATCVSALQRTWNRAGIQARAEAFSYAHFRDRLKALLPG